MDKIEELVEIFLSRIEDETGTARRYAKSLKGKPPWTIKEASNG